MNPANWRKSTYSTGQGGECVEVAQSATIHVRDTKDHATGPVLRLSPAAWTRFTRTLR